MKPCRLWRGAKNHHGYGMKGVNGRTRLVHRAEWEKVHGPIPPGMCCLHRCDTAACHEIEHLFLGTPADNSRDMVAKGRQPRGERNGGARLTDGQVTLMRLLYEHGYKQAPLGVMFGVTERAVNLIVNRKRWAHI